MSLSEPTITALSWIPKGAARARPVRFELNSEEYARIKKLADGEEELEKAIANRTADGDEDEEDATDFNAKGNTFEKDAADNEGSDTELPPEFKMDEYDDEESLDGGAADMDDEDIAVMEDGDLAFAMDKDDVDEDEAEDNEDDEIRPTDSLLVIAKTEDEYSHLEVLLMAEDGNLYTHHDITLPDMPLCLAWMDCPPYQGDGGGQLSVGNYMAVGTFAPAIEIWNLDVLDPLEPTATLGGIDESRKITKVSKKTGKKKVKDAYLEGSHTAAVMSLSWNTTYRQALASGSADSTVKVWDVTTQQCSHTFSHHSKEVQSVSFHPAEAWLLATGSYDRTLSLVDCRSGSTSVCASLPADIESLQWNPHNPYQLYGSLEDGQVLCVDVRNTSSPHLLFQAHPDGQTVSALSFSPLIPGLLATASKDKTVKVWDVNTLDSDQTPRCVAYKTMKVGQLFAMSFSGDEPFTLAVGGDKGMVAVWESDEQEVIKNHFESRVQSRPNPYLSINNNSSGASSSSSTEMASLSQQINTTAAELADESWMDDNTGIETGGSKKKSNKDKKKKDKK